MQRVPNVGPIPDGVRRRLEPFAKQHGVTVDRLVEVMRVRRRYKRAVFYRRRARRRILAVNPTAKKVRRVPNKLYAGEGEFHALLRLSGLNQAYFAKIAGVTPSAVSKWKGFPISNWPCHMLRLIIWTQNVQVWMQKNNIDPNQFNVVMPTKLNKNGRYPRKRGDLEIG